MSSVYIAGPMRGYKYYNFPAFDAAAAKFRALGWHVLSPAEMDRQLGFDEKNAPGSETGSPDGAFPFTLQEAAKRDLDAILSLSAEEGDAIALIAGWEKSKGANAEKKTAEWMGLQILSAETGLPFTEEVRSVNPVTGGEKGVKPERFALIPPRPLAEVARVYGYGALKYSTKDSSGARNWERGYEWSKSIDALERHLNAFKSREDRDRESGLHHLAHSVFHCLALMEWERTHPELDDRA